MDLIEICRKTRQIVKDTAETIKQEGKEEVSVILKNKHDFVTHVDKKAEENLVNGLNMILPQAGFITEEGTASNNAEQYVWIIDPLDGTTNFIHKCPPYSISVALMYNHELIMGVIHEITSGDTFYSWLGHDVYLNDDKIHVSQVDKLADSFIATGFPYINYQRIDPYMELLRYLMEQTPGVRRLGSAAIDLAYVAAGRFEAFFEYNLNPWDVAAGAFLVHQAGGRVSDFKGGQDYLFGNEIIACNSNMYDEFQKVLSGFMNK